MRILCLLPRSERLEREGRGKRFSKKWLYGISAFADCIQLWTGSWQMWVGVLALPLASWEPGPSFWSIMSLGPC